MVPKNNSAFLDSANYALVRFMQGFLRGKRSDVQIFDRWLGPQSVLPLTKNLRELVIEAKQEIPNAEL